MILRTSSIDVGFLFNTVGSSFNLLGSSLNSLDASFNPSALLLSSVAVWVVVEGGVVEVDAVIVGVALEGVVAVTDLLLVDVGVVTLWVDGDWSNCHAPFLLSFPVPLCNLFITISTASRTCSSVKSWFTFSSSDSSTWTPLS